MALIVALFGLRSVTYCSSVPNYPYTGKLFSIPHVILLAYVFCWAGARSFFWLLVWLGEQRARED
jgi:hypothetical protein